MTVEAFHLSTPELTKLLNGAVESAVEILVRDGLLEREDADEWLTRHTAVLIHQMSISDRLRRVLGFTGGEEKNCKCVIAHLK